MSFDLTLQAEAEIWAEAEQSCPPVTSIDRLETIYTMPSLLGRGYRRDIELAPGFNLSIFHQTSYDVTVRFPANEHPVQFVVNLSGVADSGDLVLINPQQGYIGGSGIQRSYHVFVPHSQPEIGVNIHIQPQLVRQFLATPTGELPVEWLPLMQGDQPQQVFSPKTTGEIRSVVQQIIDCPLVGTLKQLYLQGKVFELMALQLAVVRTDHDPLSSSSLRPNTIAQIHHAAEILRSACSSASLSRLEHPPSQVQLAQRVGLSDACGGLRLRTLRRGFQVVFGTTVCGYLIEQRLIQAEQLLRETNWSVAEVAHRSGYSNQGHFAAAFKRKFGITPKQCAMGRKVEG